MRSNVLSVTALLLLATLAAAVAAPAPPAAAAEVQIYRADSQGAFLAGTLEGISVDPLGRLRLADRIERLTAVAEPFLLAAAPHPEGWVVGTGNAGKVLLVRRDGSVEELFSSEEPQVFAVTADDDGTVWAASSPEGKLYRWRDGETEIWLEPGERYIWAVERGPEGGLLLATGTQGRLYRVPAKGRGDIVYDSDDTHLRALLTTDDGTVLVGTAGEGLIQALTPRRDVWVARTLHDATAPEVVAFTVAPDGTRYAAVAASEASFVDLSGASSSSSSGDGGDDDGSSDGSEEGAREVEAMVTVSPGDVSSPSATGTRRRGFRGPRSEVLAISPAGVVESLWRFEDDTVFDLLHHGGRLWVGTGLEGKLFAWNGSQMVLEKDLDERQVVAVLPGELGPAFATTNAAALFRVAGGTERQGVYTSAAVDADQIARFGTFRWRGEVPRGGAVEVSLRSGVSAEPDRTWSEWTPWRRGAEVELGEVPRGRYAQYRLRLQAADGTSPGSSPAGSPLIYGVELTYRQENLRPRVERLSILDPGQVLVPANFNPSSQVYEPTAPRPDGIFTGLAKSDADGDLRLKTLWKPGYRSLRWEVEDANRDELVYGLAVRSAAGDEDGWLTMAEDLEDDYYVFDARVLPDGVYRFRLRASDGPDNPDGEALVAERVSEPVVVDHAPPDLVAVERAGDGRLRVRVRDALSPLARARVSADAGDWRAVRPEDGLLDGRGESFLVSVPEGGARLLLLHLMDAAYNEVTYDLLTDLD